MRAKFNIVFITNTFPFGKGETFIENEVPFLSAHFETIYFIPLKDRKNTFDLAQRSLPGNCKVIVPEKKQIIDITRPSFANIPELIFLLFLVAMQEFKTLKTGLLFLRPKNFIVTLIRLNRAIEYEKVLKKIFEEEEIKNFLVYSYWVDSWLPGLIRLRKKINLKFKIVSRIHRGDLYQEAASSGYQPYRKYLWKHLDYLYPISGMGYEYLLLAYPELKNKMKTEYLGVKNHQQLSPYKKQATITIVSCSVLIPVKRVHLIIESLMLMPETQPVKWIHMGYGELEDDLKRMAHQLPEHIQYSFRGYVPNAEVMKFYLANQVDLFVNVSESEGLPVSIIEAISAGIPVIATNVGGVSEALTNDFGYLLDKDFTPSALAGIIQHHAGFPEEHIKEIRKKAQAFFMEHFDAENNYNRFMTQLKERYEDTKN